MTPEEAQFCSNLNLRILANQNCGKPPHADIPKEELKKAIDILRADYTAAQGKSKASGVRAASGEAKPAIDLASLFTQSMSKVKK